MFRVTVQVDTDVLDAIAEIAREAPKTMRRYAGQVARGPTAQRIVVRLATEPPVRSGKVPWTSERQRRAFFATNGFGGGIPYKRTHRLARGWNVGLDNLTGEDGGVISVYNNAREAIFVQGFRQQTMHLAWPHVDVVVRDEEEALQDELIDAWWRASGVTK